mmetsp:Transcript_21889/g.67904  ORF Transcript_21889/g.67904 Transcript_21889/m.67904 type:complete len:337 (-) Transcript_21889:173-1183(-)
MLVRWLLARAPVARLQREPLHAVRVGRVGVELVAPAHDMLELVRADDAVHEFDEVVLVVAVVVVACRARLERREELGELELCRARQRRGVGRRLRMRRLRRVDARRHADDARRGGGRGLDAERALVAALGLPAAATLVAGQRLGAVRARELHLGAPLARSVEAVPSIPHGVIRSAVQSRGNVAPLEAQLLDARANHVVLCARPRHEALVDGRRLRGMVLGALVGRLGRAAAAALVHHHALRRRTLRHKRRGGGARDGGRRRRRVRRRRACVRAGRGLGHLRQHEPLPTDRAGGNGADRLARLPARAQVGARRGEHRVGVFISACQVGKARRQARLG